VAMYEAVRQMIGKGELVVDSAGRLDLRGEPRR